MWQCGRAAALRVRSLDLSGNVVFGLEAEGTELNERLWRHCLLVLRLQRCLVSLTLSKTALGPKVAFRVIYDYSCTFDADPRIQWYHKFSAVHNFTQNSS